MSRTLFNSWPYGCYVTDDSTTIFDRLYNPLVRMRGRWPNQDPASAVGVSLKEKVFSPRPIYFYRDKNDPRFDIETRRRLMDIIDSIPIMHDVMELRCAANGGLAHAFS